MLNIKQDDFTNFVKVKAGLYSPAVGICFNQMSASKGIKLYWAKAVAAMFKEYKQLEDFKVLGRINVESLSHDLKRRALRAINLIKLKRCGKMKGRTCADGSTERSIIPHSIFWSTHGHPSHQCFWRTWHHNLWRTQSVSTCQSSAILKVEGEIIDIMCEVNPEYIKNDVRRKRKESFVPPDSQGTIRNDWISTTLVQILHWSPSQGRI